MLVSHAFSLRTEPPEQFGLAQTRTKIHIDEVASHGFLLEPSVTGIGQYQSNMAFNAAAAADGGASAGMNTVLISQATNLFAGWPSDILITKPSSRFGLPKQGDLSPLTRGSPLSSWPVLPRLGLIPAHAGSTMSAFPYTSSRTAHPRSRGEHYQSRLGATRFDGSSPLTRGAPSANHVQPQGTGLIPAHAGSTHNWVLSVSI